MRAFSAMTIAWAMMGCGGPVEPVDAGLDASPMDATTSIDAARDVGRDASSTDDASTIDAAPSPDGALVADAATDAGASDSGEPPYTRPAAITVPPLTLVDVAALPIGASGHPVLYASDDGSLELDTTRADALTALGACLDLVSYCVSPPTRSFDACVVYAPRCATTQPWTEAPCCPTACLDAYEAHRMAGAPTLRAFHEVFFDDGSCFPGLLARLAVTP